MIWFACKQCAKRHSRPESSIGTLIFCDCGQSNTVPWESTVEAPPVPEAPPAPPRPVPPAPRLDPVPVGEERVPPRRLDPEQQPSPRGSRRPGPRRRDPRFCLNHEDTPVHKNCADCGDPFCADCLVELRAQVLCGPCKNLKVRVLQKPPQLSGKALSSVLVATLCLPLPFCMVPLGFSTGSSWLTLLALLPQLLAVLLGVWALRDTETDPRVSGRPFAVTGALTGAVTAVLTIVLTLFPPFAWA
jgi:hypothetical protein